VRAPRVAAVVLLLALHAAPAAAQGLAAHAPRTPQARPLHERLAAADAAAIGSVADVALGRIRIERATPLLGSPGESFELKRAPSRPPALSAGDRALLLLRGARSPYVLVDAPPETVVLADPESEARWRRAIGDLTTAAASPAALRDLYLAWLVASDASLREAAAAALASSRAPFHPLPPEVVGQLIRDATDAALDPGRRRASARVVLAGPGAAALLARLPGEGDAADAAIVDAALRRAALGADLEVDPLLARALLHPREDVRASALQLSSLAARSPTARPALEQMAAQDPVEELRRGAQEALAER
jgi:hypothetical protein